MRRDLISTDAPAAQRQRILAHYVQRMLQQKGTQTHYQQSQVVHWLGWLAQQLARRSQTEFSIERIQPDWLLEQQGQRVYEYLGVRLPGVLFGIAVGPIIWIASSSITDIGMVNSLYYIVLMMLIGGLIGGLLSGNNTGSERHIVPSLIPALIVGVLITLVAALLYKLNNTSFLWVQALKGCSMLGFGSFFLSILVLNGFVGRVNTEIFQVSAASGSLKALWSPLLKAGHLRNGIVVGLIYGLAFWLDNLLSPQQIFPLFGGLVYGLILGISGIILSSIIGGRGQTVQPVEVLVWSWSDFGRGLASLKHLRNGLIIGAACGLMCGLTAAARNGAGSGLRVLLSRAGVIPSNYQGFLDEAAARILLRKVGGSYIFIHRLLLDYFAKVETLTVIDQ